jgi:hypothetical protein
MNGTFAMLDRPWGLFLIPVFLCAAVWLLFAGILVFKGEGVDKPNRVASFYGYTVCLVALAIFLTSLSSIVGASFERAIPCNPNRSTARRSPRSKSTRPRTAATQQVSTEALPRSRTRVLRPRFTDAMTLSSKIGRRPYSIERRNPSRAASSSLLSRSCSSGSTGAGFGV